MLDEGHSTKMLLHSSGFKPDFQFCHFQLSSLSLTCSKATYDRFDIGKLTGVLPLVIQMHLNCLCIPLGQAGPGQGEWL